MSIEVYTSGLPIEPANVWHVGQSGEIPDIYATNRIGKDTMLEVARPLFGDA